MKRKLISFVMCMAMVGSIVGCKKAVSVSEENQTVDICEPIVREYLEAGTEEAEYKQLPECSTLNPNEEDERFYRDSENQVYCRADIYESVMQIIENGYEADGYTCRYFNHQEGEYQHYVFSKQEIEAVEQVLQETPMGLNEMAVKVSFPISDYMEEFPFSRYIFDLAQVRDEFYLEIFLDNGTSQFYKVPKNLEPTFKKIYQSCVGA